MSNTNNTNNTNQTDSMGYTHSYTADGTRVIAESKSAVVMRCTEEYIVQNTGESSYVGMLNINEGYDPTSIALVHRALLSLTLPELPPFARIAKAELILRQIETHGILPDTRLALYAVTEEDGGKRCPAFEEKCIGFTKASDKRYEENHSYTFDITGFVLSLLSGARTVSTLLLKVDKERVGHANENIRLCGVGYPGYPDGAPTLRITYETGLSADATSRSFSRAVGAWGESAIDLATGRLSMSFDLAEGYGLRAPLGVKAYYNSALAGHSYTKDGAEMLSVADFSGTRMGHGFWLSAMQSMTPYGDGYLYTGEGGTTLYFAPGENGEYEAADGGGAVYNADTRTLTAGEEKQTFDDEGRLVRCEDGYGNGYTLSYDGSRLTGLTDGIDYTVSFSYAEQTGFLARIADGAKEVSFAYENGVLTELAFGEQGMVRFARQNGLPTAVSVCDKDGTVQSRTAYTYLNNGRVSGMIEYGADGTVGTSYSFAYTEAERRTVVTAIEPADLATEQTEAHTLTTTYAFNHEGEVVSSRVLSSLEGELGTGDMGQASSAGYVKNFLRSPGLGEGPLCPVSNEKNVTLLSTAEAKYGTYVLSFHSEDESASHYATLYENAGEKTVDKAFSAYVKVHTPITGGEDAGVFLRVYDTYSNVIIGESEHLTAAGDYVRLSVPFCATAGHNVRLEICQNGAGGAYVCGLQLEKGAGAGPFNMLGVLCKEWYLGNWRSSDGVISEDDEEYENGVGITGSLYEERYVRYSVPVKKAASTRETFTLSGWAWGNGLLSDCATFALKAVFRYEDGTEEKHVAAFTPETEAMQFVSLSFAKKEYKPVKELVVYCDYSHNTGAARFFDPCLTRDSLETGLGAADFTYSSDAGDAVYEAGEETVGAEDTAPVFEEAKDTYGNPLTETTYTDGEFGTLYRSFGYSENGDFLTEERDTRGNVTSYTKHADFAKPRIITDRCGNKTVYTYATPDQIAGVESRDAEGNTLSGVSYEYDVYGNMTAISRGDGQKYTLGYDAFHNLSSIGIEGKSESLASYLYTTGGRPKAVTYANGDNVMFIYNAKGQVLEERWKDKTGVEKARYKYVYDGNGNILRSLDIYAKKEYTYGYEEDRLSRAVQYTVEIDSDQRLVARRVDFTVCYRYDKEGNLTKKVVTHADGTEQTVYYETNEGNTVAKFVAGESTVTSHSKTDTFGRKLFEELQFGTGVVSRSFDYYAGEASEAHSDNAKIKSSPITQLVSLITMADGSTLAYEYDAEERITSVTHRYEVAEDEWQETTTTYTYDALGQLLTETVTKDGVSTVVNAMVYDNYGNILSKNGKSYTYGDSVWKDLLTAYDGQTISYDAQGDPTSYLGHTLTWEKGRQLKKFVKSDGTVIDYTYNANGIRTSKTVDGIKHEYVLDGTKILRETLGENTLVPLYDNEDSVCGIVYNNVPYYFIKNLQGDVIAIANARGEVVARYSYDAWGVPTVTLDASGCQIATINPYRYRSYYYDTEIAKYYLQSRYYDPIISKFINADDYGLNITAEASRSYTPWHYCYNNPINFVDECGYASSDVKEKIKSYVKETWIAWIMNKFVNKLTNDGQIPLIKFNNLGLEMRLFLQFAATRGYKKPSKSSIEASFKGVSFKLAWGGKLETTMGLTISNHKVSFMRGIDWKRSYFSIMISYITKDGRFEFTTGLYLSIAHLLKLAVAVTVVGVCVVLPTLAPAFMSAVAAASATAKTLVSICVAILNRFRYLPA